MKGRNVMPLTDRQKQILKMLKNTEEPISGTSLSTSLGVSRQIIVSDISNLRLEGYDVISTTKGYVLGDPGTVTAIFKVWHKEKDTKNELNIMVDLGVRVKDVFIYHRIYGEMHAKLEIKSRKDVDDFCQNIESGVSAPLSSATGGYHDHTIIADGQETIDELRDKLMENGFLAKLTEHEPEGVIGIE